MKCQFPDSYANNKLARNFNFPILLTTWTTVTNNWPIPLCFIGQPSMLTKCAMLAFGWLENAILNGCNLSYLQNLALRHKTSQSILNSELSAQVLLECIKCLQKYIVVDMQKSQPSDSYFSGVLMISNHVKNDQRTITAVYIVEFVAIITSKGSFNKIILLGKEANCFCWSLK